MRTAADGDVTTGRACCRHCGGGEGDIPAADGDAATLCAGRTGIEKARDRGRSLAAFDHDYPAFGMDADCPQRTGDVDRVAHRIDNRGRAQFDARRRQRPISIDQGIAALRTAGQHDLQEPVAGRVKCHRIACAQADPAKRHVDRSAVFDTAAKQRGKAAAPHHDAAAIGHTCRTTAVEGQLAGHEIAIGNIERRGDKSCPDFDGPGRGDGDAVGIDQINLTVACDAAGNSGGRIAGHSVQHS